VSLEVGTGPAADARIQAGRLNSNRNKCPRAFWCASEVCPLSGDRLDEALMLIEKARRTRRGRLWRLHRDRRCANSKGPGLAEAEASLPQGD